MNNPKMRPLSSPDKILVILSFVLTFGVFSFLPAFAQGTPGNGLGDTLNNFDDAFDSLRSERDELRREVAGLKEKNISLEESVKFRIQEEEAQKQKFDEALDAKDNRINNLEAEKEDLRGKVEDLEAQINRFNDLANNKDGAVAEVKDQNQELKSNLLSAERVLARSSDRIQKLQETKENLQKEVELLRREHPRALEEKNQKLSLQLKSEEEKINVLQKRIDEASSKEKLLRQDQEGRDKASKEKSVQLQEKYDALLQEHKKLSVQSVDTTRALTAKIKELNDKCEKK